MDLLQKLVEDPLLVEGAAKLETRFELEALLLGHRGPSILHRLLKDLVVSNDPILYGEDETIAASIDDRFEAMLERGVDQHQATAT